MRADIRAILDGKKPATPRIGRKRIRVMVAKTPVAPAEVKKLVKRTHVPSTWILDRQTAEELRAREFEAQMEAEKSAAAVLLRRLANARPTGERCTTKACPFPAVLDGQCRRHAMDRAQMASLIPSPLGVGAIFLT